MSLTNFPNGITSFGVPVIGGAAVPFTGKHFFVDPVNGSDGNKGTSPDRAFATLYKAHDACTSGANDVVYLIGDGGSTGTARLSLANAQSVDSTATTGTLTWSKSACHLIGVTNEGMYGRARIAPPTGTYTESTFNALPFITVSGSGCQFANLSIFHGFSTGANGMIALNVTGGRNCFTNCSILGMNDAASAQGTSSRSLKISSTGENTFVNCVIGGDTTTRTVANASIEFASATPRNVFRNCVLPFQTSAAGVLGILCTGAGAVDRFQLFDRCTFVNNIKSTSTQMTVLASMTNAAPGGMLVFKDCALVGITKFGDTNALANSYIEGGTPAAATTGLAVNPS